MVVEADEFIAVKGFKATGKRLTTYNYRNHQRAGAYPSTGTLAENRRAGNG